MGVTNLRSIKPAIWIPPIYTANFKVTIERTDGTIDDITDIIEELIIEDGVTEGIGIFEFKIPNPNETYTTVWTGMEIFRFYCDYASGTPTTLRFRGRIERPSNQNNRLKCSGRSESLFVIEKDVTKSYDSTDAGEILYDLFDAYGDDRYDLSEINTSTGLNLTLAWTDNPFWSCVEEICIALGYDCYISAGLIVKFFEQGNIINSQEGIVHDYNKLEVSDFAPDLQFVKNKIRVYGANVDGAQIIYTANDLNSQGEYGIRVDKVDDSNILTVQQAKEFGEYTLANSTKNPPTIGEVISIMLATIQPGEKIWVSSPMENIPPDLYRIVSYKHEIDDEGLKTTITINKQPQKLAHVLRDRVQIDNKQSDTSNNPHDMDFSWVDVFNEDSGTHSNTEIASGVLKLIPAIAGGSWESPSINVADERILNQIVAKVVTEDAPNVEIYISGDNGVTYQLVTPDELTTVDISTGSYFKVKLRMLSQSARIDTVEIKYTTKSG